MNVMLPKGYSWIVLALTVCTSAVVMVHPQLSAGFYRGDVGTGAWIFDSSNHTLSIGEDFPVKDVYSIVTSAEDTSKSSVEAITIKPSLFSEKTVRKYYIYEDVLYSSSDYREPVYIPDLEVVRFPQSVVQLEFPDEPLLRAKKAYELDGPNSNFAVYDGCVYTKDYQTLLMYPREKQTVQFHPALKVIGRFAFYQAKLEDTLVLPWGITTIEYLAFSECSGKVVLPDTVTQLPADFHMHASLTFSPKCTPIYSTNNQAARIVLDASVREHTSVNATGDYSPTPDAEFYNYYKEIGNWETDFGNTYFYYSDGSLAKGWTNIKNEWYYFDPENGALKKGVQVIDGKIYYLGVSGARKHDRWKLIGEDWYYLNSDGAATVKTWIQTGENWYFLQSDGTMAKSTWIHWKNHWYYVGDDGVMYQNRKAPGGYWVNHNGAWVS